MQFLSVIKRVVPFVFAVTVGVLIASIFVPLSSPAESFKSNFKSRHDCKRFKREMRELRRENIRLSMENEELRMTVERQKRQCVGTHRDAADAAGTSGSSGFGWPRHL